MEDDKRVNYKLDAINKLINNLKLSISGNKELNHEAIHTEQMKEMLYIFFYIWYGIEYLIIRLFHIKQHDAYKDVSFEEEAHINDDNLNYISERKHYTWTKYLGINSSKTA